MNLSATQIGRQFKLNGQEMNMVLKCLGYLDGEPGNYSMTKKGLLFGCESDYHRGPGGYSWYNRDWTQLSYDESIIDNLRHEITPDIIQKAVILHKEHCAALKVSKAAAQIASSSDLLKEYQQDALLLVDSIFHSKNWKPAIITSLAITGVVATGTCIYIVVKKYKKRKAECELEQLEQEHDHSDKEE